LVPKGYVHLTKLLPKAGAPHLQSLSHNCPSCFGCLV